MIDDLWLKIFILIYFCIVASGIGIDIRYYSKYFRGTKNGRKDKS
jgi:hypothetical protein